MKNLFRNLKNRYIRSKKGWCPSDTWDLNTYVAKITAEMLDYLAERHVGLPPSYGASEQWEKELRECSKNLRSWLNNDTNSLNEYSKEFIKQVLINPSTVDPLLREKYYEKEKELYQKRYDNLILAFKWLMQHWEDLWD